MLVVPEGGSTFFHNLNHDRRRPHRASSTPSPVAPLYNDVLTLWGESGVGYTPTLVVGYGGLWGENYWYATENVWEDERLLTFTPRGIVDSPLAPPHARPRQRVLAHDARRSPRRTSATAASASTSARTGRCRASAAHWELWMFGQGGMTPLEAIRAATLNGARYVGLDGDIGSIEEGKLADFARPHREPARRPPPHARHPLHRGERPGLRRRDDGPGLARRRDAPAVVVRARRGKRCLDLARRRGARVRLFVRRTLTAMILRRLTQHVRPLRAQPSRFPHRTLRFGMRAHRPTICTTASAQRSPSIAADAMPPA